MRIMSYATQELTPKLRAETFETKDSARLVVTTDAYQPIFIRDCESLEEALELLKCFGHGLEYMGVRWCAATRDGLIPIK
ncbi:MAG: hypothetical protein IJ087_09285 [Eggerthellaceae bacterium]|nr:hypothetical protein [Eggerthellaceae bacterium]